MNPLRWGILGPGRIAPRIVRAVGASARSRLVGVASRDLGRARAFGAQHTIERAYGSYADLLADAEIDVVYVALPNHLHAPWTVRALAAGKHVLCEKPLALSVGDVDEIVASCARSGRIAVEAFMSLHHPQTLRALELARTGALGRIELVTGSFSFFLTYPGDPRVEPAMGGGSLWDVGCYPVNLARRLAGEEPDRVQALARFDDLGVDRTFVGQLHFPGGILAQFDSGFSAPDRQRIEIVGGQATLVMDAPFLTDPDGPPPSLTMWRDGTPSALEVPAVDQYRAEVEDLERAVLDGSAPRVDLAFSRGGIAALVALDAAARANAGLPSRGEGGTAPPAGSA